jgi:hypothetical protein
MSTRFAGRKRRSARARLVAAALLAGLLGGCQQIAGIEPWKPVDCESDEADPEVCKDPSRACAVCLFASETLMSCDAQRQACTSDMMTACSSILDCERDCGADATPEDCMRSCCSGKPAVMIFNEYMTCACGVCKEQCGSLTTACTDICSQSP